MKLTVIPSQQLIIKDGEPLTIPAAGDEDFCALHWNGTTGRIERMGEVGLFVDVLEDDELVLPFVELWDSAKESFQNVVVDTGAQVRQQRDMCLRACDWTQLADVPMTDAVRQSWKEYREALRMVPQQEGFPESVTWPQEPATE